MLKYILVGYDGSDTSRRAFELAIAMARWNDGRVRVVSVLQLTEGNTDACTLAMTEGDDGRRVADLRAELAHLAPGQEQRIDLALVHGSPGDALLNQVLEHGVDHVVIGHTERGALARWLLGSVSGDVLARAHVPVTVVR